ncbi:MAG TPA: hypothetical protein VF228_23005 [Iamia sp.]
MVSAAVLVATRQALHAVAEHVLAAALHGWNGRLGLRVTPGGFGTPVVAVDGVDQRVRVEGIDLVVETGGQVDRAPLTTLGAAAALVGIEPGAPTGLYEIATPCDPSAPLAVDAGAAAVLAAWFALVDEVLGRFAPTAVAQLWPEHLDVALALDEVNYGGSPGDATHPTPYLYVGPWSVPAGDLWNEPWGVSWPAAQVATAAEAVARFEEGRAAAAQG